MALVMQAHAAVSPHNSGNVASVGAVTTERYGRELRESFLDRPDGLHFYCRNTDGSCRLYTRGRPDGVREVHESAETVPAALTSRATAPQPRVTAFVFTDRSDGLVRYERAFDLAAVAWHHRLSYVDRSDGVTALALSLRSGAAVDIGSDSAASVYQRKLRHAAVAYDDSDGSGAPHGFADVLLEVDADAGGTTPRMETLRIAAVIAGSPLRTREQCVFRRGEPTDDPRFEVAKTAVHSAVRTLVALERQLYVALPPFEAATGGSDDATTVVAEAGGGDALAAAERQSQRLSALAASLFAAMDAEVPLV